MLGDMTLGELIARLEKEDHGLVLIPGFGDTHSDRGSYCDIAFEPLPEGRAIGETLASAKLAIGATFQGYKGGDYVMDEHTTVCLGNWGECGEHVGETMLNALIELAKLRRKRKAVKAKAG